MILLTIFNLSIARFLNVWIVSWLVNRFRSEDKIPTKFKVILWIAGLRGAMAYALALYSRE